MNWNTARAWLGTLARLVLGVIWVWASWHKLQAPRSFVQTVRAYDATPEWLSSAIGYGLPVLEFLLGVLLIIGITVRIAASVSAVLLVVFLIGIIQASARGLKLECGCFSGGGASTGGSEYALDILRDVGLLVLAVYLVVWSFTRFSLEEFLGRHDYVEPPSAKRMRTENGRRKYEAQVEAKRRAAHERNRYLTSSLAIVVVLIAIVGIGVQAGRAKISGTLTATHASLTHGVIYGKKAAATVDIYEDFGCPHCLEFEQATSAQLDKDVKANLAQVRFHPLSILDRLSKNQYSTRAANAAICASDAGVDEFVAFHNVLFGKDAKGKQIQPAENSSGPTDAQLVTYAQQAKLTAAQVTTFTSCVSAKQHNDLVAAITDRASKDNVSSTPTVIVNGTTLKTDDLKTLSAAIAAADAKGPAPSPSPTSSASTSASPSTAPSTTPTSTPTSGGSSSASASASG